jgi:putative oxidoreductase
MAYARFDFPTATQNDNMSTALFSLFKDRILPRWIPFRELLDALQSPALLAARLYVAWVFFASGLTKLRDWDTTLALFTDEYKVPLLSPAVAAFMGTAGEIVLPVLLALGLASRFSALGLFVVNAVAVIALQEIAPAAFQQHVLWGSLLATIALFGGGKWCAERWMPQAGSSR